MAAKGHPDRHAHGYWQRRIRSPAFRRALINLFAAELRALSRRRVRDVIDRSTIRAVIRDWDPALLDARVVADMVMAGRRRLRARLRKQPDSLRAKLGARLAADIEELVRESARLSHHGEELVAETMRQEFARRLFSELVFTSLLGFQEKVNPLFGGIAMRLLEERIRGFIDFFMPLLQEQATAFVTSRENQRVLREFVRSIVAHLLDAPLSQYADLTAAEHRKKIDALLRTAILDASADAKLETMTRDMAVAICDDMYALVANKSIGELLRVDDHAEWLAERAAGAILGILSRPAVLQFIAAEGEGLRGNRQ